MALLLYLPDPNQQQPAPGAYGMPMGGGLPVFGDLPASIVCPYCQKQGMTRIEKKNGLIPWLACLIIFLFGGFLGCCLIPFCIKGLKVDLQVQKTSQPAFCRLTGYAAPLPELLGHGRRAQNALILRHNDSWKPEKCFCLFLLAEKFIS